MTRRGLILTLLPVLLVFGCSRPVATAEKSAVDAGQPARGDWAVVRFEADPDTLNPLIGVSAASFYALTGANNSQIYELLMGYNSRDWDVTEPLLAEAAPEVSSDGLTYTLNIRD